MLARALFRVMTSLRVARRRLGDRPPRPLQGAAPAVALALLLAACAPALSASPAAGTAGGGGAGGSGTGSAAPVSTHDGSSAAAEEPLILADAGAAPSPDAPPSPQLLGDAAAAPTDPPAPSPGAIAGVQEGNASWYGPNFAGRLTSNGEIFDPSKLTAAHRTLPFGTLVKVTNLVNGESVVVRINDRGPFKPNRIIDLSEGAAKAIGMVRMGVARVRLEPLSLPDGVVRLGVDAKLSGYQVLSRFHKVGQLLLLSRRNGANPVVVRVVGTDVPPESGADVLVASDLYDLIGAQAHLQDR